MNRPANPLRAEHRRLESMGGRASNRGDHAAANVLWRLAGALKRRGQDRVGNAEPALLVPTPLGTLIRQFRADMRDAELVAANLPPGEGLAYVLSEIRLDLDVLEKVVGERYGEEG